MKLKIRNNDLKIRKMMLKIEIMMLKIRNNYVVEEKFLFCMIELEDRNNDVEDKK